MGMNDLWSVREFVLVIAVPVFDGVITGRTDYTAAYKGDECLYYQEQVEVGKPFDQDALCRGSSWAGNVSLQVKISLQNSQGDEFDICCTLLDLRMHYASPLIGVPSCFLAPAYMLQYIKQHRYTILIREFDTISPTRSLHKKRSRTLGVHP